MAIRWYDPVGDLAQMQRTMERLFDQCFGPGGTSAANSDTPAQASTYQLPLDILDGDDAYMLYASVPGFTPEQVDVTYSDGVLAIVANAPQWQPQGEWLRRERLWGNWVRRLQLPSEVEAEKIQASFENGVLAISVPKAVRPKPIKIAVGNGKKELAATT
jgi:HSP20 family protein